MSIPTRDELIECIRRSGLVEEERLNRFLHDIATPIADPVELSKAFVTANLLTDWQRERLLEKKWKGFFLGKYKIQFPLGAGAMGSVFKAEHKVMRHAVALKVLAKRLVSKPTNVTRFEREARAAAVVNHPNIVRAFDIDRDGETHYLVMEYVQGENLQKIVQTQGPLDPLLAAEYVRQICLGLHEAHANGLVHRDIKPSNVLLDVSGLVKILDLGLARIEDEGAASLTIMNESKMIGTVDYLAPEQALNSHKIDGRADIYSLGCSLYYMLTGLPPFPSGSLTERILKHQTKRPMDIRKRREGVPDELIVICNRMMEKQPGRRYQTAGEAAESLAAFIEGRFDEELSALDGEEGDGGGGYMSLPEDSSSGRSGIHSSKSVGGGRSSPQKSAGASSRSIPAGGNLGAASRSISASSRSLGAAGKSLGAAGRSLGAAGKSLGAAVSASTAPSTTGAVAPSKPQANSVVDDLDLTPMEDASTKRSGASMVTKAPGSSPAIPAKAGDSRVVLDETPGLAPLDETPSLAGGSGVTPMGSSPSLLEASLAPADPLAMTSLSPLGDVPTLSNLDALSDQANLSPLGMVGLDPLGSSALGTPLHAAANALPSPPRTNASTISARPSSVLEVDPEEGVNYPLWFLIVSGLGLSVVLLLVGYSFMASFFPGH